MWRTKEFWSKKKSEDVLSIFEKIIVYFIGRNTGMEKLIVLSLSTDESVGSSNFEKTMQHLKYSYLILGRGVKFMGWPWRTRLYIDAINKLKTREQDLFVLCDSNDLFFVAPPEELIEKFNKIGKSVLVGAEPACCNGYYGSKNHKMKAVNKMRELGVKSGVRDQGQDNTRYVYPNGGFVMGRAKELLSLLESNKNQYDDQGGYLQKIMDDPNLFHLDRAQTIVGNLPNMHSNYRMYYDKNIPEIDHWKFSIPDKRWRNVHSEDSPVCFHFPGKYWKGYNAIAQKIFPINKGLGEQVSFELLYDKTANTQNGKKLDSKHLNCKNTSGWFVALLILILVTIIGLPLGLILLRNE